MIQDLIDGILFRHERDDPHRGGTVGTPLMRSSSSASASYSEARSATTRREFSCKLHACVKELRESLTWLNQIAYVRKQPLTELRGECDQLVL
jgi:four helix bundle protein